MKNVTKKNAIKSVTPDREKITNYIKKTESKGGTICFAHTHPKTSLISLIPSITDLILSKNSNVIYINEGKRISGQVHYHAHPKYETSFKIFQKKARKTFNRLSKIFEQQKLTYEQQHTFKSSISKIVFINELLSKAEGRRYLEKEKPILNPTKYNAKLMEFCLENGLFNRIEILNFLKYKHLFNSNKSKIEMYEILGIQLKFVANKYGGYKFDPNTIEFIRK